MRYALVDDATLESAKKMEGITAADSTVETVGDILALENLIQAVLFRDGILYLDPAAGKKQKKDKISALFQATDLKGDVLQRLLADANQMTDQYVPCIEGGRFTDELLSLFFKALDMDLRFAWKKGDGIYHLIPRIIPGPENHNGLIYRKLLDMILSELSNKSFMNDTNPMPPLLYDSEGQIINDCYMVEDSAGESFPTRISPQADALFKAIHYMAFQSNLHLLASKELNADPVLSPMRTMFLWAGYHHFYPGTSALVLRRMPLFTFWIAEHWKEDAGFINTACELREQKEFAAVRRILQEMDAREEQGSGSSAVLDAVMARMNDAFDRITKKYSADPEKNVTSAYIARIGGSPLSAKLPEAGSGESGRQSFCVFYRSAHGDLLRIHEMIGYFNVVISRMNPM